MGYCGSIFRGDPADRRVGKERPEESAREDKSKIAIDPAEEGTDRHFWSAQPLKSEQPRKCAERYQNPEQDSANHIQEKPTDEPE
jgi:hypothetical protein